MTFISEEEAYNFYNAYAIRIDFSITKSNTTRRIERVDCQARIEFKIDRSNVGL